MNLVIGASVAIKWFAPEALSLEAERLLDGGDALFAPDLLLLECGNIIWKKVRLGELARPDGDAALAALRSGPIDLVDTRPLVERALQLAHEIEHPVYDCVYLAAAEAVDAMVVTADRRFFERCSPPMRSRIAWLADVASAPWSGCAVFCRVGMACSKAIALQERHDLAACTRWWVSDSPRRGAPCRGIRSR